MRTIKREIVSALIFSKDGKLLMGKKDPAKGGVYAECWHLPGGGIDEGENKEQALVREVKEETNLDIGSLKQELVDDTAWGQSEKVLKDTGEKVLCNMHFNVYKVNLSSDSLNIELQPTDDLVELKWIGMDELKKVKLTPPSEKLFSKILLKP